MKKPIVARRKLATGRPPRGQRTAPKPVNLAALGPLDVKQRYSIRETAALLRTSLPTVFKLINKKSLEVIKEGARTYVSGRSIAIRSLPPQ